MSINEIDESFLVPVEPPLHELENGKLNCILQGQINSYPGNASTVQYFQAFMEKNGIQSKVALIDGEKRTTFGELDEISTKLALAIKSIADQKKLENKNPDGDWVIGLCLPPCDRLLYCIFAIHKLGCAYVPIDRTFPENRVLGITSSSRPIFVIADSITSTLDKFKIVADQLPTISYDELLSKALKTESTSIVPFPSPKTMSERVGIILYTSGSSGPPKGVRLTHQTIMSRLFWQWKSYPYEEIENLCFKTAFTFVDSVPEIFMPLLKGHKLHIFSKLVTTNPNLLIKTMNAANITRIIVVPSLLRALISSIQLLSEEDGVQSNKLCSLKICVCSSEPLTRDLVDQFFEMFPNTKLFNFYGSTEIMGDVSYEVFSSAQEVEKVCDGIAVPIGVPMFNTILYVLTEDMKITPQGEIGELCVAGYNLSSGYVGINSDKFIINPFCKTDGFNRLFRTGDFVRIGNKLGHHTIFYEGRNDSQIKIRGQRVDLNEVQSILNSQSEKIDRAIVLCYNAGKQDQALVAFIIPSKKDITQNELVNLAKGCLKPFEVPTIRIISEVPLLINGKVDRQRLLSNYSKEDKGQGINDDSFSRLHLSKEEMEKTRELITVISEITHVPQCDVLDNMDSSFFNIGGTSLNSVSVVAKLRTKNLHIPLDDFVSAKSIREIISKLSNKTGVSHLGSNTIQQYFAETLNQANKNDAIAIIAQSFSRKGDLEVYTNASYQDFTELITELFPYLEKQQLSFVVRRKADQSIIGVNLNFDLYNEPNDVTPAKGIAIVLDFLEVLESVQREKLPKGIGEIIHSFMMGTHENITEAENVPLVSFMEEETNRIAKQHGFCGILTTNTNPLTIQVCSEIYGFETLVEYQVNKYVAKDGSRPFRLAPDSQIVVCCWKRVKH